MTDSTTEVQKVRPPIGGGVRGTSSGCVIRVLRAFLVCRQLTIPVLIEKSDVSKMTAYRIVAELLEEKLITKDKRVYTWKGGEE